MVIAVMALIPGAVSAAFYARRRAWINAALALLAGLALDCMQSDFPMPGQAAGALTVISDGATPREVAAAGGALVDLRGGAAADGLATAWARAPSVTLLGDGLSAAQWRDLPARPLHWQPAAAELLWLDFPRELALGRTFTLTARRAAADVKAGARLQLLAENGRVIAESAAAGAGDTAPLSLQWLPPVAEAMLLQARLLDGAGKVVAQGPLPLVVRETAPLQVQGRFGAPSFDARALNTLLTDSDAILDWQVTLGKTLTRSETARTAMAAPNLMLIDAAWFEHAGDGARQALLKQVAGGAPLLVLAGNAADAALWSRQLALRLRAVGSDDGRVFNVGGAQIMLAAPPLQPEGGAAGPWTVLGQDAKHQPWLWQRDWGKGRVLWLGAADWHRYAISAPLGLGLWWQQLLDQAAPRSVQKLLWQLPDALALPGVRSEVCAVGALAGSGLQLAGAVPATTAQWQLRADRADAVCSALWPRQAGWLTLASAGQRGQMYVYGRDDWPAWQRALRRDASAVFAARLPSPSPAPGAVSTSPARLPAWPFGLLFAACMLLLWWRERR